MTMNWGHLGPGLTLPWLALVLTTLVPIGQEKRLRGPINSYQSSHVDCGFNSPSSAVGQYQFMIAGLRLQISLLP
ncbi:hypothetical protein DFJ58DRAFT_820929 [Suillus subalutaceus]|uniref:uncharacterized protein n=1 Tax=Suillus subalutaceus TaxID=48586 RepID=UPI001B87CDC5|nr:uncharacterized protein DFJ58DRAFT_820929 [Suillus subalutaceus]KAG1835361.1 hypothetical protein DFJ58DRAFT_820929 [Suillus subalutaceus]